jgi:hypothetical protein
MKAIPTSSATAAISAKIKMVFELVLDVELAAVDVAVVVRTGVVVVAAGCVALGVVVAL